MDILFTKLVGSRDKKRLESSGMYALDRSVRTFEPTQSSPKRSWPVAEVKNA
jgi:hypothetical protein